MRDVKHTPGDWQADEEAGMIFTRPDPLAQFVVAFTESGTFDEQCANARLIAAAPTLLEALKDADAWIGECYRAWAPDGVSEPVTDRLHDGTYSRRGAIRAAIAKATQP